MRSHEGDVGDAREAEAKGVACGHMGVTWGPMGVTWGSREAEAKGVTCGHMRVTWGTHVRPKPKG